MLALYSSFDVVGSIPTKVFQSPCSSLVEHMCWNAVALLVKSLIQVMYWVMAEILNLLFKLLNIKIC